MGDNSISRKENLNDMANKINFTGLWIPEHIILDKKLADKEKLILAMIIFLSKNDNECTTSNQSFADRFDISSNRVSKIISSLKNKNYIKLNFIHKDNSKEILKRTIIPIGNIDNTPIVKNNNLDSQKQQSAIGENDKVIIIIRIINIITLVEITIGQRNHGKAMNKENIQRDTLTNYLSKFEQVQRRNFKNELCYYKK